LDRKLEDYAIRRAHKSQDGLKLNGTVYAYDINITGISVCTIMKNAEALGVLVKEIGLEVNADKTQYMVMCSDQNVGQSQCQD
jgi:hypothetical protein